VGSCTFTFLTTGDLLSGIGSVTVPSCSLLVRANNVHPGGGPVNDPVTLSLSGGVGTVTSTPVTLPVLLDTQNELFVVNPGGQQVDMGLTV